MRFNGSRLSKTTGRPICAIVSAAPNSRPSKRTMAITAAPAMIGTRKLFGAARSAIAAAMRTKPGLSVSIGLNSISRNAPRQRQADAVRDHTNCERNGRSEQREPAWLIINPKPGSRCRCEVEAHTQQQRGHAEEND